jgi:pimeloyl-ACP methyl ester carboxylesterase
VAAAAVAGCDPGDRPRTETCDGGPLRPVPADTAEHGPWTVGVRTVDLDGLTVEVFYPAGRIPQSQKQPVTYDLREQLPAADRKRISDEDAPRLPCDCYRDVPADLSHGAYPVVIFLHGKGGFRTQSLSQMLHWASRGFVVLAADLPGLRLEDVLEQACSGVVVTPDVRRDVKRMLAAVRGEGSAFEFLGHRLDGSRVAIAGHSAGGLALASFGDLAQVLIPMAAGGVQRGRALESTLVLGGTADTVVPYRRQRLGYALSPAPKRLVGLAKAGHLAFSNICTITNENGESLSKILDGAGVCGASVVTTPMRLECDDDDLLPAQDAWEVINPVTAAVIEETLYCDPDAARVFETLEDDYPAVAELLEKP